MAFGVFENAIFEMDQRLMKQAQTNSSILLEKTLVIGARGFLGSHFLSFYQQIYPKSFGTHYLACEGFFKLDLADPTVDISKLPLDEYKYAIIAAGISKPDTCEKEPQLSYRINVTCILELCEFLIRKRVTPILISSGYVFDGVKGKYTEDDEVSPINIYGTQRAEMERRALKEFENECLIVRIGKAYSLTKGDGTLIDEMAQLLFQKKEVFAACDQILSPISTEDITNGIAHLQTNRCRGLYHLGGAESISRYDLALKISEEIYRESFLVKKIFLDDLKSTFKRPKRSNLISRKLVDDAGFKHSDLKKDIQQIVSQYRTKK